jgi:hypothetical protein
MLLGLFSTIVCAQAPDQITSEKKEVDNNSLRAKVLNVSKPDFKPIAESEVRTFKNAKHNGNSTKLTLVKLSNVNLANAKSDPVLLNRQKKGTVHKRTITPTKKGK